MKRSPSSLSRLDPASIPPEDEGEIGFPPVGAGKRFQFLILVEIVNFAILRRHVGRQRCDVLMADVAERALLAIDGAQVRVLGPAQVEIVAFGADRDVLAAMLDVLTALFDSPVDIDGERYALDVALGATAASMPHHDDVRMIEEAEQALADARIERRPVERDLPVETARIDRIALARDLHVAIGRSDELFLQYQPKVHVRRQQIASVEALIRWRHPTRGLVLPGDFIPIAEDSRDIVALTLWTLRQVITDQKTMAARGYDVPVFINIAGVLLSDTRFVAEACTLVQHGGAKIGFEITETSVIRDPESAIANLKIFAEIGIDVAIDDYGAGLSSLAYLKQLPACELKIDKLFVTQLTSSNRDPLIVRSTIDLAHALEMEVVAEGVETQAALALLTVMGCDMVQGFLISRPIGLDALLQFFDEGRHLAATSEARVPFARFSGVQRG